MDVHVFVFDVHRKNILATHILALHNLRFLF